MEKLSKSVIDGDNQLTSARIKRLLSDVQLYSDNAAPRPKSNLKDLMEWVQLSYGSKIGVKQPSTDLIPIINNAIGVEGAFVQYCEQNNIKITPLLLDSVSSWNTNSDTESFMVQGVFLIETPTLKFIHAALFSKGNQFEDEISYFVIVERSKYIDYVNFRNDFIKWETKRSNQVLEVKVIGGEDYAYIPNSKWDDVFLPDELKVEIKSSLEAFLSSKDKYMKNNLPWKRGILLHGPQGNGKTTLIHTLISEYNLKPVTVSDICDETLYEAFKYAEQNSPSLLFIEDADGIFKDGVVNPRMFLNMLDGLRALNGVVVVLTTNYPKRLPKNLVDRRSRIDRIWGIPSPSTDMAFKFMRKWFHESVIDDKALQQIVKMADEYQFSYGDLKEIYISTMFSAMGADREIPTVDDLTIGINLVLKEKRNISDDFEITVGKKSKKFGFAAVKNQT